MPKTNSVLSNLKFSIKKLLFLVQGYDRIHISSIFDSKNAFANFHTHDFMGSKHMLKCFSLGCKHYEALFRTKWSSQTQKIKIFIKWLQVIVRAGSWQWLYWASRPLSKILGLGPRRLRLVQSTFANIFYLLVLHTL